MQVSRRLVLSTGSAVAAALAGCQSIGFSNRESFDLNLFNYTDEAQSFKLEILSDGGGGGDSVVFDNEYTVPAPKGDDSAGTVRQTSIVPQGQYLVRVLLDNGRGEWHHSHIYPDDTDTIIVRVYRDASTGLLYVRFT